MWHLPGSKSKMNGCDLKWETHKHYRSKQANTMQSYRAWCSTLSRNLAKRQRRWHAPRDPEGIVAAYVWDYAGKMQLMRHFWNAAAALDPAAYDLDEGRRFPICHPEPLRELFQGAGLHQVEVRPIDIATDFQDFDDYWSPFLGGQGPAPGYAQSLSDERRAALRERIRAGLPFALDGSIPLVARAWAVRGVRR